MKQLVHITLVLIVGTVLIPFNALAGDWGIGVAVQRYQHAQKGVDRVLEGIPFFLYQGERLNVGLGELSYALVKSSKAQLAIVGQARFEDYDPEDSSALTGMEKCDPAFEAGFGLNSHVLGGEVQLKALGDITGTRDGYEISMDYRIPYQAKRLTLMPAIGLSWQSEALVNYYYGVRASEARSDRPVFTGRSATNTFVDLTIDFKLTRRWNILGGMKYVLLDDNIEESPIIDKSYELSMFGALLYRF